MFTRRMFVALAACVAVTASSAFAGGGGTKKDSTIQVNNESGVTAFAFVDVAPDRILTAFNNNQGNADAIVRAFNRLGGKSIADGANASFSVKSGNHRVIVIDIETENPDPEDNVLLDSSNVVTTKGQTTEVDVGVQAL